MYRCLTFIEHLYNMCQKVQIGVQIFFLLRHFLDRCLTPVKHLYNMCRTSISKEISFSLLLLYLKHISDISTRINDVSKNNVYINEGLKTLHFDYNMFIFFDSIWINKDKIESYFVLKYFFNAITCSTKMHMHIY
jgi:hypothetical protein